MRAWTSLAAAVMLATLAGCGATQSSAGNFKGEQRSVAQVIDDLSTAASGHNTTKICNSILASSLAAQLKTASADCPQAIGHQLDDTDNFSLTVQTVSVNATTATATVKSTRAGKSRLDTLALVKQSNGWRLSGLGG